jgi:hypothetical protein
VGQSVKRLDGYLSSIPCRAFLSPIPGRLWGHPVTDSTDTDIFGLVFESTNDYMIRDKCKKNIS